MIRVHPELLTLILTISGIVAVAQPPAEPLCLWYRQLAQQWVEALAVGNGRLGAMVFGGVAQERIQLNEDTLWPGRPTAALVYGFRRQTSPRDQAIT